MKNRNREWEKCIENGMMNRPMIEEFQKIG
jgi:hypothetical protein